MVALVCGLDVPRESAYATILNSDGKIVNQRRIGNESPLISLMLHRGSEDQK